MKYTLLISSILNGLVFIGLGITRIPALQKYIEVKITFASLDNSVVLITGLVLFTIGFMT